MLQKIISISIMAFILASCSGVSEGDSSHRPEGPSIVEMRNVDGRYRLFVNGEEFFVKGAGCQQGPCYQVAAHGGNAIRTWSTGNDQHTGQQILDDAWEHGLMVLMGIWVEPERHGFDYDDEEAVARQLQRIREEVIRYKDHPALLGWGIGNELNLYYENMRVWDAVNDIAKMIKEVDGNHIVTTMLAGIGKKEVDYIAQNCPDIDFISTQMYGGIVHLEERFRNAGYDGPFLVTEWGATGHWEVEETKWGSPIEQTSSEKAEAIIHRYNKVILGQEEKCMGSFVFLWGQKQERTPSWYGLFTEKGEKTEAVQAMEYLWTGSWPENRGPVMSDFTIEGKGGRFDNIKLSGNGQYTALIDITHSDTDALNTRAEIMPEPTELSVGGDYEPRPASIEGLIISANTSEIVFNAPQKPGAYRILVYVTDQHNNAATANIPFFIED